MAVRALQGGPEQGTRGLAEAGRKGFLTWFSWGCAQMATCFCFSPKQAKRVDFDLTRNISLIRNGSPLGAPTHTAGHGMMGTALHIRYLMPAIDGSDTRVRRTQGRPCIVEAQVARARQLVQLGIGSPAFFVDYGSNPGGFSYLFKFKEKIVVSTPALQSLQVALQVLCSPLRSSVGTIPPTHALPRR
jgi:hypothetical protein